MQCLPMVPAFRCCAEMLLLLALFGLSSSPENSECLKYCLHEYQDSFVTEIAGKKQNSILCELPPERDSKVDYYSKYLQKVIQKYIIPKITSRELFKSTLFQKIPPERDSKVDWRKRSLLPTCSTDSMLKRKLVRLHSFSQNHLNLADMLKSYLC